MTTGNALTILKKYYHYWNSHIIELYNFIRFTKIMENNSMIFFQNLKLMAWAARRSEREANNLLFKRITKIWIKVLS